MSVSILCAYSVYYALIFMMLVVEVILVVIMNQVKDVRVPAQLMRAMAAEAEAAREARAKVVLFMTIRVPKK